MRSKLTIPINDLSRRKIANSDRGLAKIAEVLKNGRWIQGPEHSAFEKELSEFLGVEYVLGVASGTDALEIALRAVGCKRGSKVITVSNAGAYGSIAALNIGCELIYCDIDPKTSLMDFEELRGLLTSEIDAVIVTHLFGNVAPVLEIKDMCNALDIRIIEDCAQALGGFVNNQSVGSLGDVGAFSFYPTKNLGGIGDGGALSTNNVDYAQIMMELRQYGWRKKYDIQRQGGINSRLDEIQAAVLRIELEDLQFNLERRRLIVERYKSELKDSPISLINSSDQESAPHLAVIVLPDSISREDFREYLLDREIQTDIHYPILDCDQPGLFFPIRNEVLPNTRLLSERIVTIPLFPELLDEEVETISSAISQFVRDFLI